MSRGLNVEKRQKEVVRYSRGSLSITINQLAVMTVCDKSLGEESLSDFQTETTQFWAFKKTTWSKLDQALQGQKTCRIGCLLLRSEGTHQETYDVSNYIICFLPIYLFFFCFC